MRRTMPSLHFFRFLSALLLGALVLVTPTLAEAPSPRSVDTDRFDRLTPTLEKVRELQTERRDLREMESLERSITEQFDALGLYPERERVHGHKEPTWLSDRGELSSQAVLALSILETIAPDPKRRELLEKIAYGLVYLQRKERFEYPFGAHVSWRDREPLANLDDGTTVPTVLYRTESAYAVEALAEAGRVLDDSKLTESSIREALGMSTHLLIHGNLLQSFSPQPKYSEDIDVALPLVRGFLALHKSTGERIYSDLAALSTHWNNTGPATGGEWDEIIERLKSTPSADLLQARPVGKPISFQFIEAEEGRVVNKAIETLDYVSSVGLPGTLAVMGRENTFWMRFDVPIECDYVFGLSYLQSDVSGGLVSVMMRIDGDRIFQVQLGDVDGQAILRRAHVDGPRPLRAGPHSFGIRFSGLLMTKPALLDSVVVQPAVERREFALPNGEKLYLLRNVTAQEGRADLEYFDSWPPVKQMVVDGDGNPTELGSSEDRRRRKVYTTLPPYGVALLWVNPEQKKAE